MMSKWLAHHWREVLIAALAVAGVVGYIIAAGVMDEVGFPLDDAWIHQTYARNLAERGEWAFVPGQPSVASTSPLYTVLLSVGYVLNLSYMAWTAVLGAVSLAAAGWIGTRLGGRLFPEFAHIGLWTGAAMVVTWHLVWAAASGMETMVFCALSLLLVWLLWREQAVIQSPPHPRAMMTRGGTIGLVGAALTLTRPEGAGLVALAGLFFFASIRWPALRTNWRVYLAWAVGLGMGWLVGMLPYLALNYDISGEFLPNTSAAKQAENAPARALPLVERYGRMLLPLVAGGQLLLLPGFIAALLHIGRRAREQRHMVLYLVPVAWIVMDVSAYALRLPAPYQHGRYVIPVLPFVLLYGVGGTLLLVRQGRKRVSTRVLTRSLALSAVLVMAPFWGIGARQFGRDVRMINTEMVKTAKWIRDHPALVPEDQLLAVHDIGALGYFAPRPILDLAGLVSPEVVPIIRDHDALMEFMRQRCARFLMVLPDQRPAEPDDPRLGTTVEIDSESGLEVVKPLYRTDEPYAPAAGSGNMVIYRLQLDWPPECVVPVD